MKTKNFTRFFVLILTGTLAFGISQSSFGNKGGAPAAGGVGNTGSPGDGQTCSRVGCHTGVVADAPDLISTNIPPTGYISSETYVVTVAHTDIGNERFGFQASPQNISGDLLGTLSITDVAGTKLVGGGKYVTHTINSIDQFENTSWTFEWTAPTVGTGDVTFYTCINVANGNGTASGDSFVKGNLTIPESSLSSFSDLTSLGIKANVLQNPVQDKLNLILTSSNSNDISFSLVNIEGKKIFDEVHDLNHGENYFSWDASQWNSGIYLLSLVSDDKREVKKIIVP